MSEPKMIGDVIALPFSPGKAKAVFDAIAKRGAIPRTAGDFESFSQIGRLVSAGKLAEALAISAAEAVRLNNPKDPAGYYFATLRSECAAKGIDIDSLRRLKLRPTEGEEKVVKAVPKSFQPRASR